jgi:GNAT superfamily N-acetyltransferase
MSGAIEIRPATIERFGDIEVVINRACACQYWRMTAAEYGPSTYGRPTERKTRRVALRRQAASEPAPGIIAYLDDVPVGWCGFGPRSSMLRLEQSRQIPRIDDRPVWSIVCFTVRPGYRRRGIARALLRGAIEYMRAQGAAVLEAYATDSAAIGKAPPFTGSTSMFEAIGFRRVVQTTSRVDGLYRWVMRLDLGPRTPPTGAPARQAD